MSKIDPDDEAPPEGYEDEEDEHVNARIYRIERKINIIVDSLSDKYKKKIKAIVGGRRRRSRRGKRPRKSRRSRRY